MQALDDEDVVGLDQLWWILVTCVMVINWFVDCLALLQGLNLCAHECEVIFLGMQGTQSCSFASSSIVDVVVVKADDRQHVANGSVTRFHFGAQRTQDSAKECGLAT